MKAKLDPAERKSRSEISDHMAISFQMGLKFVTVGFSFGFLHKPKVCLI